MRRIAVPCRATPAGKPCGRSTRNDSSRCDRHEEGYQAVQRLQGKIRHERQWYREGYKMPQFAEMKRVVKARSGGNCEIPSCFRPAEEVDHIIPLSSAATFSDLRSLNNPDNGIHLCHLHHVAKTTRDRRK